MPRKPRNEVSPVELRQRRAWAQYLTLERATQLDLFIDREQEAAEALDKLKRICGQFSTTQRQEPDYEMESNINLKIPQASNTW
jgi:hypothetical protein